MPQMLQMDEFELAARIQKLFAYEIPPAVLRFFFDNSELVIKPDLWRMLCTGLLMDEDHFEKGQLFKYSKQWAVARLKRYHEQGRANVYMFLNINSLSEIDDCGGAQISRAVSRVEKKLLARNSIIGLEVQNGR
jgi:hypothetical protein